MNQLISRHSPVDLSVAARVHNHSGRLPCCRAAGGWQCGCDHPFWPSSGGSSGRGAVKLSGCPHDHLSWNALGRGPQGVAAQRHILRRLGVWGSRVVVGAREGGAGAAFRVREPREK
jgi:hypothetical protein